MKTTSKNKLTTKSNTPVNAYLVSDSTKKKIEKEIDSYNDKLRKLNLKKESEKVSQ
jgi:hypothetical protein